MWRLVGSIMLLGVFLIFMASNSNNKCDISFLFVDSWTIREVPVYLTVLASFLLGMFCSIPVLISLQLSKRKKNQEDKNQQKKSKKKIQDASNDAEDR
jgi:uncharacterized integral membrane protein